MKPVKVKSITKTSEFLTFEDILIPDFVVLCQDYILGKDGSLSIFKTIDLFKPSELPLKPKKLVLIATFYRNPSIDPAIFSKLAPELRVSLRNPSDATFEIGVFPVSKLVVSRPWLVERLIIDLSEEIQFNSSGGYFFEISGRVEEQEFKRTHTRVLPIAKPKSLQVEELI